MIRLNTPVAMVLKARAAHWKGVKHRFKCLGRALSHLEHYDPTAAFPANLSGWKPIGEKLQPLYNLDPQQTIGLVKFLHKRKKLIVSGKPRLLETIQSDFEDQFERLIKLAVSLDPDPLKKLLNFIFNYTELSNSERRWNIDRILTFLDVRTCPYCNRAYASVLTSKHTKKLSPKLAKLSLDHFLPKGAYPMFAVSFYNLVPSCTACNSGGKGDNAEFSIADYIHPHIDDFGDDMSFRTKVDWETFAKSGDVLEFTKSLKVGVELTGDDSRNKQIQNSMDVFNIEDLYACHRDIAQDLFSIRYRYPPALVESLVKELGKGMSQQDIWRLLLGNHVDKDRLHERPLAKFTRDIARDVGFNIP